MLFLKSLIVGISIAAPVGPIGMLCIQRSLQRGFRSGLATGLGAACADSIYGLLGAVGLVGVATAVPSLATALKIAGGAFLVWMAWGIAKDSRTASPARDDRAFASTFKDFLTTFALTLSSPMTILSFIAVFAALGPISIGRHSNRGTPWVDTASMVAGVFVGSAIWWLCLSGSAAALRRNIPVAWMQGIALVSAVAIGGFGLFQLIAGLRLIA